MIYGGQNKYTHRSWRYIDGSETVIGHLHGDVILLLRPESFKGCFFVQIKTLVIETSLGLPNLNMKGKTKRILVVVLK